jgi:hypothetical protein
MKIISYYNKKSKFIIRHIQLKHNIYSQNITKWYNYSTVMCYILYDTDNKSIISFALLSTIDSHPIHYEVGITSSLDYIYTLKKYRRNYYAFKLLTRVGIFHNYVVMSNNKESFDLFSKIGCK